jgi:hypothetical protein
MEHITADAALNTVTLKRDCTYFEAFPLFEELLQVFRWFLARVKVFLVRLVFHWTSSIK